MTGREHILFGTITTTAISISYTQFTFQPEIIIPAIGAGVLAALLPDIDTPKSLLGRLIYPIAWIINKIFGHRTITHDLAIWIPVGLYLLYQNPCLWMINLVMGYWGHLFLDSCTAEGVPICFFLKRKNFHLLPYKWKIYSNSVAAKVFTVVMSIFTSASVIGIRIFL